MVKELERHKVKFVPSKLDYLRFMFEFNYQIFELSGETPPHESCQFLPCTKSFIQDDLQRAKVHYFKRNTMYKLWVPPVASAKRYARDYLKQ